MLNKKGQGLSEDFFFWIWYIIGIIIFLFVLGNTIAQSITGSVDTAHLEYYLLYNRLTYSKDSVFYYDESIDRVYPGIIDLEKFYEETLNDLFGNNDDFGIKLSLGEQNKYEIFYNKELYQTGKYVFKFENPVYGGLRYSFPVVAEDNDVLLVGFMYEK